MSFVLHYGISSNICCGRLLFLITFSLTTLRSEIVDATNEIAVLQRLKDSYPDWHPNAIIDVGANRGKWSKIAYDLFKNNDNNKKTKILMFEAARQHVKKLKDLQRELNIDGEGSVMVMDFRIAVLTDHEGDMVPFFRGGAFGGTGNSMFREQSSFFANATAVERISSTLDAEVSKSFLKDEEIDYLKIDVQGAELLVLRGATEVLKKVTFVQIEGSVVEFNDGGVCFHELDEFLRHRGFFFYDFGDPFYNSNLFRTKGVGQFDALYIRPASQRLPSFLQRTPGAKFCGASQKSQQQPNTTFFHNDEEREKSLSTTIVLQSDLALEKLDGSHSLMQPQIVMSNFSFLSLILGILIGMVLSRVSQCSKVAASCRFSSPHTGRNNK